MTEKRSGTTFICDMPGPGPWRMTFIFGGLIAVSPLGTFRLWLNPETDGIAARWEKIEVNLTKERDDDDDSDNQDGR